MFPQFFEQCIKYCEAIIIASTINQFNEKAEEQVIPSMFFTKNHINMFSNIDNNYCLNTIEIFDDIVKN